MKYGEVKGPADIVTVSHEHRDHNYTADITGNPQIIKGVKTAEVKGIKFNGVATFHDEKQGKERGLIPFSVLKSTAFVYVIWATLGHKLSEREVAQIGKVDVLTDSGWWTLGDRC